MKRTAIVFLLACAASASVPLCLCGQTLDRARLADAIYLAEGGPRASVPYGILTVKVRDEKEARAVCLRTIDHAWRDYSQLSAENRPQHFIPFLANRYCPAADAPGNRHWKHNVTYFYQHSK